MLPEFSKMVIMKYIAALRIFGLLQNLGVIILIFGWHPVRDTDTAPAVYSQHTIVITDGVKAIPLI